MALRDELRQILFPDGIKCIVCGKEIHPSRYSLCVDCGFTENVNYCLRCGRHKVGIGDYCGECRNEPIYFDEARSAVDYTDSAQNVVWRMKYGDAKYMARPLAQYMIDTLIRTDWVFDCFTFVPSDKKRARRRGYNQAEMLANELSALTTKPCFDLLEKIKTTTNQARLTRQERLTNLVGAFKARFTPPEHVVIVDDVMTTGATLNECAKTLKKSGAKIVYALTFASVPEKPLTDKPVQNIRDFRPQ
ncbi:MAG: ComF family protein [Clostridiales bacterium]|nr:ComF family protein [Clostridiales bacterium]